MKDGKKIEIFQNQNGENYYKDADGKSVIIDQNEVKNIITEKKKVIIIIIIDISIIKLYSRQKW